jgi:hypothetical protein
VAPLIKSSGKDGQSVLEKVAQRKVDMKRARERTAERVQKRLVEKRQAAQRVKDESNQLYNDKMTARTSQLGQNFTPWHGFRPFLHHYTPKAQQGPLVEPFGVFRAPLTAHFKRPAKNASPECFMSFEKYLTSPSQSKPILPVYTW